MRILQIILSITIFVASAANGQGLSGQYDVYSGDQNGDGLTDFLFVEKRELLIIGIDNRIPIVRAPSTAPFILERIPATQTYSILPSDTLVNSNIWQISELRLIQRDINLDGTIDIQTSGLEDLDDTTIDQLIISSQTRNDIPIHLTALTPKILKFTSEVNEWYYNHNYFDENAPEYQVENPPTSVWFGVIPNPTNFLAIGGAIAQCEFLSSLDCTASDEPPPDCIREVQEYDSLGELIGTVTINVCAFVGAAHVYANIPGTVTIFKDYTVFDQDAVNFANEILAVSPLGLENLGEGITEEISEQLDRVLVEILIIVFGEIFGDENAPPDDRWNVSVECQWNDVSHDPFPFDDDFDSDAITFHHYDEINHFCDLSDPNCLKSTIYNDVLRRFSYPSERLEPTDTPLDGVTEFDVYVTFNPLAIDDPEKYTSSIGPITQTEIVYGTWARAIVNNTEFAHLLYPGKIGRTLTDVFTQGRSLETFTHGIGLSQLTRLPVNFTPVVAIRVLAACANDYYGPEAFKTLDGVAKDYWESNGFGGGQAKPTPPPTPVAYYTTAYE